MGNPPKERNTKKHHQVFGGGYRGMPRPQQTCMLQLDFYKARRFLAHADLSPRSYGEIWAYSYLKLSKTISELFFDPNGQAESKIL